MRAGVNTFRTPIDDDAHVRSWNNFFRSRITWMMFAAVWSYASLAMLLPNGWLSEVMRCIQITTSFMVIIGYWRRATQCFYVTGRWPEKHHVIALGIEISWLSLFCNSCWALLYRLAGQPSWMINNDYYTSWTAASSFAACLHIFAPNLIGQDLPKMDRVRFSATGLLGLCLVAVVGIWRPDLRPVADWLHQHLAEPEWAAQGLIQYFWNGGWGALRWGWGLVR